MHLFFVLHVRDEFAMVKYIGFVGNEHSYQMNRVDVGTKGPLCSSRQTNSEIRKVPLSRIDVKDGHFLTFKFFSKCFDLLNMAKTNSLQNVIEP